MSVGASDVVQGGALVILFVFVVAFGAYFRERDKRSEELTRSIVERALNAMDAGVEAQRTTAEAMARLCATIDVHARDSSQEHSMILTTCQGLSRQGIGGQRRVAS